MSATLAPPRLGDLDLADLDTCYLGALAQADAAWDALRDLKDEYLAASAAAEVIRREIARRLTATGTTGFPSPVVG